jgi:hypothetical protein
VTLTSNCISGLADPGPIASMFWLDDGLGSDIYLDGIVTLVDAKHIRQVSLYPAQARRHGTDSETLLIFLFGIVSRRKEGRCIDQRSFEVRKKYMRQPTFD